MGLWKQVCWKGICFYPRGKLSQVIRIKSFFVFHRRTLLTPTFKPFLFLRLIFFVHVCARYKVAHRGENGNGGFGSSPSQNVIFCSWAAVREVEVEITLACDSNQKLSQRRLTFNHLLFWCLKHWRMKHLTKTKQLKGRCCFSSPCRGVKSHVEFEPLRVQQYRWWPLNYRNTQWVGKRAEGRGRADSEQRRLESRRKSKHQWGISNDIWTWQVELFVLLEGKAGDYFLRASDRSGQKRLFSPQHLLKNIK